ncbi:MAG: DUF1570 domain-containing protein [Porphyrobacter sp.]|nr:DUF1570 domain-containing protein [Porphyrobacter sp.]
MIRRFFALAALAAGFLAGSPAAAEWHKAETDRFVVYSDTSEKDIRSFAERLERFHTAMAKVTGFDPPKPSPSNRVTVYAVGSDATLKRIYGDSNSAVAGFYIPRAGGSVAFVPNVRLDARETDFTLVVLLHEYAHHFTLSSASYALPRWITEGMAEFFASVKFEPNGGLDIGLPANHRIGELNYAKRLNIEDILDYDRITRDRGPQRDGFYGQAWLMFHYLMFSKERLPQYRAYVQKFRQGEPSLQAAEEAFGDLDTLDRELKLYQRRSNIPAIRLNAEALPTGDVTVTPLSEGMNEMIDVIIRSRRGVNRDQALALLPDARRIADKYPGDAGVLTALAEAEYDAGNDAEAIAAADRALAIDPSRTNAYVQKGYALFRIAAAAEGEAADAAYVAAMEPFQKLNAREPDHPLPLIYYYRSYVNRGREPVETARAALERAEQLAPFDKGLRLSVGIMMIREGRNSLARYVLAPLAADAHGRGDGARAAKLIAVLEKTPDGQLIDMALLKDDSENAAAGGADPGTDGGDAGGGSAGGGEG